MSKRYAPILPSPEVNTGSEQAGSGSGSNSNSTPSSSNLSSTVPPLSRRRQKREQVSVACQACRGSKQKCNAERPICGRCRVKGIECHYDVEQGEATRYVALKRKYDVAVSENESLRELFEYLRKRPESEAREIYTRIRASEDVQDVLKSVRDADLLLQNPSETGHSPPEVIRLFEQVDQRSLRNSALKVPARPWTVSAGDGLVSELLSSFFQYDDLFFLPFVDKEAFVEDMRKQNLKDAKYCSQFLVNAICALRSCTSPIAKALSHAEGEGLWERFADESKRHMELDLRNLTLPAAQALFISFLIAAYRGNDRDAAMYRYACCAMVRRLNLEKKFEMLKAESPTELKEKRIISRAAWGLFHAESCYAYIYLQPALIRPPKIPRMFDSENVREPPTPETHAEDQLLQEPVIEDPGHPNPPSLVSGAVDFACQLSEMLFEIMTYNASSKMVLGSGDDLEKRKEFYNRLEIWKSSLPADLRSDVNFTMQTALLENHISDVVLAIIRPLAPNVAFPVGQNGFQSVKDLCIERCTLDVELLQRTMRSSESKVWMGEGNTGVYNAAFTLLPFLDEPRTHQPFTKACFMLRAAASDFPMLNSVLQRLQAQALALQRDIPPSARICFEKLPKPKELMDGAVGLAVPQHERVRHILSDNSNEDIDIGGELGTLIYEWARLSLD
ncbi:putative C6 transcription factor [Rhizodiscina lignyota]|uniref:C6 transcription factor n=1 Tax=Rhizodiscina lignyota TaxID=1504668 RepID=A0A9P4MAR1_9PEZI|nr:putative C6 transcription factor [Rhizodiscina lignyota]